METLKLNKMSAQSVSAKTSKIHVIGKSIINFINTARLIQSDNNAIIKFMHEYF